MLASNLTGLVYHVALEEDGQSGYVSFITHKAMREAKAVLNNATFPQTASPVKAANDDITRTELVATALKIEIVDEKSDEAPPLSFWLSKPAMRTNLFLMILVWLFTVFNAKLLNFLINSFD